MMNFLGLDVGTTCCKCQVFDQSGSILFYRSRECGLLTQADGTYADLQQIVSIVSALIREAAAAYRIDSLAVSSFGEAFVLLDERDRPLSHPMLYTDPRGQEEAAQLTERFGGEYLYRLTGVMPHAMYSLSKLLWMQRSLPEIFDRTKKILLIGDYIGYLLTGERVIDRGLAARTGAFDIRSSVFSNELLSPLGLAPQLFSAPLPAGSIVGNVLPGIAGELGLPAACKVVLGSHDQICASLGAGVLHTGQAADGLGTVECVTSLFDVIPDDPTFGRMGFPIVPYAVDGLYCTYMLSYTCGSLVNWFRKSILHGYAAGEESFFAYAEKKLSDRPVRALTLPYFAGAATPFQDPRARGAILNLSLETDDAEIYQSILEATALEMRLNLETAAQYGINVREAVVTGGGANSPGWLRIKANAAGLQLSTLRSSEGGLCGTAMLQAVALGAAENLEEAAELFVRRGTSFLPDPQITPLYDEKYAKYRKLYRTIKELNDR